MLATLSFVIAAVIFFMLGMEWEDGPESAWGLFFIALGFVLGGLPDARAYAMRRRTGRE